MEGFLMLVNDLCKGVSRFFDVLVKGVLPSQDKMRGDFPMKKKAWDVLVS